MHSDSEDDYLHSSPPGSPGQSTQDLPPSSDPVSIDGLMSSENAMLTSSTVGSAETVTSPASALAPAGPIQDYTQYATSVCNRFGLNKPEEQALLSEVSQVRTNPSNYQCFTD